MAKKKFFPQISGALCLGCSTSITNVACAKHSAQENSCRL